VALILAISEGEVESDERESGESDDCDENRDKVVDFDVIFTAFLADDSSNTPLLMMLLLLLLLANRLSLLLFDRRTSVCSSPKAVSTSFKS
jgi:hypothetical protein